MGLSTIWRWVSLITIGVAIIGMDITSRAGTPGELIPRSMRKAAPNFARTNEKGADLRLSDFKGGVVLLDFWATWCHGCKTEIPWYMEFENRYEGQGLTVIGVSMDADGWKIVKPFMAQKKMSYSVVIGNDALAKQFGLSNMPLTLLIDRDGRIADSHSGIVDKAAWEHEIQTLLKEKR